MSALAISARSGGRILPRTNIVRAVTAMVIAASRSGVRASTVLSERYPDDHVTPLLLRAAVAPETTTSASALASKAVADFVGGLGPDAAASRILAQGLQVDLDADAEVMVPGIVAFSGGFVAEADPIPAYAAAVSGPTVSSKKVGLLCMFSREQARRSAIEAIVSQVLQESARLTLDDALFGATAATAAKPVGLRYGVTPITATTGGGVEAALGDMGKLAAAVAPVAGGQIAFVAAPAAASYLRLRFPDSPWPIYPASALPARTVMAIATNALTVALDPVPEIEIAKDATIHMDSAPAQIGTASTPNVVAAPVRGLYQTGMIGVRVLLTIDWAMRTTGAVAVVENVTWSA